ncbi:MAG TPA: LLM class flavin-dependent oxidoreductase [Kribbellaceae bacterium]|nr:LLM class flavin-dependent oxidoreductase [Kribbellaceae bacterium]
MTSRRAAIGMCFHRSYPAGLVTEFAKRLDAGGADQLWVIEDCFYTAGVSLAAAALAVTERITVGVGILPAVARNPAITAMEIATLCGLGPGRVLPGIGHGVQEWMGQMGVRPASPLTALEEVIDAVRRLLAGEEVSVDGRYVRLDRVKLDQPPLTAPPVLAGVRGPKSLALAGRVAGGVVLAEPASPAHVTQALDQAGRPDGFEVAAFAALCVLPERAEAYREMTPWLAGELDEPTTEVRALPFFDELAAWYDERRADGLAGMPADWWRAIGPIGTMDDALAHIAALEEAGATSIGLWSAPDVNLARKDVDTVVQLAKR